MNFPELVQKLLEAERRIRAVERDITYIHETMFRITRDVPNLRGLLTQMLPKAADPALASEGAERPSRVVDQNLEVTPDGIQDAAL